MNKNTTVDQETSGAQIIRNVTITRVSDGRRRRVRGLLPPNYCPIGTAPGAYDFKNEERARAVRRAPARKTINMATVINMANVSSQELASKIQQDLEQHAASAAAIPVPTRRRASDQE